ncbi:MAG: hypothetical protein NVS9B2_04490 [Steroidobacteraceae bacterium]
MHPWRQWILLAALVAMAGQAAVIYKWKDSNGVTHYSDQPVAGAEKIYTASNSARPSAPAPARAGAANSQSPSVPRDTPLLGYSQFSIASPLPDQTFFGDEIVTVNLTLDPGLKSNHTLTWHLNGRQLEDQGPAATQFDLPRLDRGTYAIAATITDPRTGEARSTDSVTFFVRQPSALSPQHKKP